MIKDIINALVSILLFVLIILCLVKIAIYGELIDSYNSINKVIENISVSYEK